VVDTDHNGVDDRAYVGDSGGNVWRIEFTEDRPQEPGAAAAVQSNWHLARIAALGGSGASDRRFFHAPDVVHSRDADGDYTGVLILSGNRAAPRETLTEDFAYLLKDRPMAPVVSHAALTDITGVCSTAETDACSSANLLPGWKLALQGLGEKGLSAPLVSSGVVYFSSYLPAPGDAAGNCVSGQGTSRVYAVRLADGSPGLPRIRKLRLEDDEAPEAEVETDGEAVPRYQDIGPGLRGDLLPYGNSILVPGQGLDGAQLYGLPGRSRWRAYWREEQVDPL
jgi:type IV pilus assembly protein PilY1